MIVTLSERRFAALIKSLENIPDQTDEEVLERMTHYAGRLFKHLAAYGLRMTSLLNQRGGLADFRFVLTDEKEYRQGDPRSIYVEGLQMLNPVHLSVEVSDLSALVPNPMIAPVMRDHWDAISEYLTKIMPSELLDRLEKAASAIVFDGAATVPDEVREIGFDEWAISQGLRVPGNAQKLKEARRLQQIQRQREADEKRWEEVEGQDSDLYVEEPLSE